MSAEDETIFAEASELAQLRLEQCIADRQILARAIDDIGAPCGSQPARRFQKLP